MCVCVSSYTLYSINIGVPVYRGTISRWQLARLRELYTVWYTHTHIHAGVMTRHMGGYTRTRTVATATTTMTTTSTMNRKMRYLFTYSMCVSPNMAREIYTRGSLFRNVSVYLLSTTWCAQESCRGMILLLLLW